MPKTFDCRPGEVVVLAFKRLLIGDPRLNYTPYQNMAFPVFEGQPTILPMYLFAETNPRTEGERLLAQGNIIEILDAERGQLSTPIDVGDHAQRAAFLDHREEVEA